MANVSLDKMLAEAEAKVKTSLTEISKLIKRDFQEQARNTIALYYAHYKPLVYIRTDNLKNNVIDEDITFDDFDILNNNFYGAYVHFTSNEMFDYELSNKEAVVSNFMHGVHGKPSIYVEPEPAMELMKKFQQNYKKTLDSYFIERGFTVN